jgi:hypothetical protein
MVHRQIARRVRRVAVVAVNPRAPVAVLADPRSENLLSKRLPARIGVHRIARSAEDARVLVASPIGAHRQARSTGDQAIGTGAADHRATGPLA